MNTNTREQTHFDKYDKLAKLIGIKLIQSHIPFSSKQIQNALQNGDKYLNTLPLHVWDKMHESISFYGASALKRNGKPPVWSLCETVCVLKHVARHYTKI